MCKYIYGETGRTFACWTVEEGISRKEDSGGFFSITIILWPNVHTFSLVIKLYNQEGYMVEVHLQAAY